VNYLKVEQYLQGNGHTIAPTRHISEDYVREQLGELFAKYQELCKSEQKQSILKKKPKTSIATAGK
jgi:hypothetical protein